MMPEQTAQANIDLRGKVMMPVHWGALDLALHQWKEPVVRLLAAAARLDVEVVTPYIGERFAVGHDFPTTKWWETLDHSKMAELRQISGEHSQLF